MYEAKIDVIATLKEAFSVAIKNVLPLILLVVLYVLTIWIPYLNVATTIGLYKALIAMSKGEVVDPLSIFDKENFSNIGNFFLLLGLMVIGEIAAFCFMFVPAIIIGIAWSFAMYLMIDKKTSPLKSLTLSYDVTRGEKWRIFAIEILAGLLIIIATAIFCWVPKVGGLWTVIVSIFGSVYSVSITAMMYKHFAAKADALSGNVVSEEVVVEEVVVENKIEE